MADEPKGGERDNVIYADFARRAIIKERAGRTTDPAGDPALGRRGGAGARRGDESGPRPPGPWYRRDPGQYPTEAPTFQDIGNYLYRCVARRADPRRVERGKDYFGSGRVGDVRFTGHEITGVVSGSQPKPFYTKLVFDRLGEGSMRHIGQELVTTSTALTQLEQGRAPAGILKVVCSNLTFSCTCPDSAIVCKHVVALTLAAVGLINLDPRHFFQVHGINLNLLHADLDAALSGAEDDATKPDFWRGGPLPALPDPKDRCVLEDADPAELASAMRAASYTTVEQLRATSDIEDLYEYLKSAPDSPSR